mmetsp:Transcript_66198/g.190261  ORF Transcript_66198/g.190261 Transcript_66198/m.190261 type:complete len:202 (+) Transcript_66198:1230-1835(+)
MLHGCYRRPLSGAGRWACRPSRPPATSVPKTGGTATRPGRAGRASRIRPGRARDPPQAAQWPAAAAEFRDTAPKALEALRAATSPVHPRELGWRRCGRCCGSRRRSWQSCRAGRGRAQTRSPRASMYSDASSRSSPAPTAAPQRRTPRRSGRGSCKTAWSLARMRADVCWSNTCSASCRLGRQHRGRSCDSAVSRTWRQRR